MKIAFIPSGNPFDKHSWSGTDYYTRKALKDQGHEVYCIYDFVAKETMSVKFYKLKAKLIKKHYDSTRSRAYSRQWADFIKSNLLPGTDAIISLGTLKIAMLKTDIPIFIYVDGVFEYIRQYYQCWNNLSDECIRHANEIEQIAINNCAKIISCSEETSKAICRYYNVDNSKVETVPLGANWDSDPEEGNVVESIANRKKDVCEILFVGVEWSRKGADIVMEAMQELEKRGFRYHLNIVGLRDNEIKGELPNNTTNYGFVSKHTQEGASLLANIYGKSHFLFVPSRAEAYGLVFCEASAYGVPSISFETGGIKTVIKDDENGKLFPLDTTPEQFAAYIIDKFSDYDKYLELAHSSYKRYKQYLNWNVAGKILSELIYKSIN